MQYLNRPTIQTIINAGYAAHRQGNYAVAILNYNTAISINQQDPTLYRLRADAKYRLQQYEDAINDCNIAIRLDPVNPAYMTRGAAYYFSYKNEEALADFSMAIHLNHNPAYAYKLRADVKRDQRYYLDALYDYQDALKIAQQDRNDFLIAQITPSMDDIMNNLKAA